jgi:biotin operon repressor BirA-like protein
MESMKNEILKQLAIAYLSGQDFVSGAKLAQDLGVSRMAVSKSIQNLTVSGLPIDSVKHHGYRLAFFPDLMLEPLLNAAFARQHWQAISPVAHAFASVDSTNLAAVRTQRTRRDRSMWQRERRLSRSDGANAALPGWGRLWFPCCSSLTCPGTASASHALEGPVCSDALRDPTDSYPAQMANDLVILRRAGKSRDSDRNDGEETGGSSRGRIVINVLTLAFPQTCRAWRLPGFALQAGGPLEQHRN